MKKIKIALILGLLVLLLSLTLHGNNKLYTQELIVKNNWETNQLDLTRKKLTSMQKKENPIVLPSDFIVVDNKIFIFDPAGDKVVRFNEKEGRKKIYQLNNDYDDSNGIYVLGFNSGNLYYETYGEVKGLNMKTGLEKNVVQFKFLDLSLTKINLNNNLSIKIDKFVRKIDDIDFDEVFKNNKMSPPRGVDRFIKNKNVYFSAKWEKCRSVDISDNANLYSKTEIYSPIISRLNIDTKKIKKINSTKRDFGWYILGVDKEGRIYTTTTYYVDRILIHDKKGNFLSEIKIDYKKYGTPEVNFYRNLLAVGYPVYVTDDGKIYVMMYMEEGIFIVKYTPNFKKIKKK